MNPKHSKNEYRRIAIRLQSVTGLGFNTSDVRFMHDASRVEFVEQLAKINMIPTLEELRKKFPKHLAHELERICEEHGGSTELRVGEDPICDLLGAYSWKSEKNAVSENTAVVYDLNCLLAACKLDLSYEGLMAIVAAHEIAHAFTHLGKYGSLGWKNYARASNADKEFFAQAYAWLYSKDDQVLESTMRKLSEHQSPIYRSWEVFANSPSDEINGILRFRMVNPEASDGIDHVFSGFTPGRDIEFEFLKEFIQYQVNRIKEARTRKIAKRSLLSDVKRLVELIDQIQIRDFPGRFKTGFYGEDEKRAEYLGLLVILDLGHSISALEQDIEAGKVRLED